MPRVGPEEYDTEADAETIAANFTGAVAWLNEAAPRFAKAGAGTIVGISSVAGDRGRRGNPVYGATKAALNAYLESLRNRIEYKGAFVVTDQARSGGYAHDARPEDARHDLAGTGGGRDPAGG